jgi:hypothetical protein
MAPDRRLSACALVKGQNGEDLVAVAGGSSAGMEVWNPLDGSVKLLTDFPAAWPYGFPQMISANQGPMLQNFFVRKLRIFVIS